ncbi:NDP-sugar synthase [bacterium]|nr:NDP-sugar synthase [candidate division CSSED10-310 bacterium]
MQEMVELPPVFILAAGLGTRLDPITRYCAKPVVPIAGRPALMYLLDTLRRAGVRRFIVNAHHRPESIAAVAVPYCHEHSLNLVLSFEPTVLGTAGALVRLRGLLDSEPLILVNGDMLMDIDFNALVRFHSARRSIATLALLDAPWMDSYGTIGLDGDDRIIRFVETRYSSAREEYRGMFTGVHVLQPELLRHLPAAGHGCINRDVYCRILATGGELSGYRYQGPWQEFGTPASYWRVNMNLLFKAISEGTGTSEPEDHRRPGVMMIPPVIVPPSVTTGEDVRLGPGVVLGERCRIGDGAILRRAVIWDDVAIPREAVLDRVVVPATGVVIPIPEA